MSEAASTAGWVRVCERADLAPGTMRCFPVDGERVLVVNVGGEIHAVSDRCGHVAASLARGKLEGCVVECPVHFARFDVRTGKSLDGLPAKDIPSYPVLVVGEDVCVMPAATR